MILSSYGAACMQYSSDFTVMMREAGYIYPFDWRRRRMDRDYEEPQGIRISVNDWIDKRERYIAQRVFDNFDWEHFYAYITKYNKLDMLEDHFPCETGERQCNLFCKKFNKKCTKENNKYENNDETVNS